MDLRNQITCNSPLRSSKQSTWGSALAQEQHIEPPILKVLSGAQLGVEIMLSDGEYSFGSGDDADLKLIDVSMAPIHGALRIGSGKIELKAEQGRISTDSGLIVEPGDDTWREIAQLDKIIVGTTVFAVAPPDAKWDTLIPDTSIQLPAQPKPSTIPKIGNPSSALVAASVVIACVFAILYLTKDSGSLTLRPRNASADYLSEVETTLATLPFQTELSVALEADGVVSVVGYVQTGTERRAVQNALIETNAPVRRRIWALEAIETDVKGLIESQNLDISYSLNSNGILTLGGISLDSAPIEQMIILLETQVFGLGGIENNIKTANDFLQDVERLIDRVQLTDLVIARLDGLLVETTGVVPIEKRDNWVGFVRSYARNYAKILPLRSFVTLEGAIQNGEAIPIVVGDQQAIPQGAGRILIPEELNEIETQVENLFAYTSTDDTNENFDLSRVIDNIQADSVDINAAIDSFAQENPEVVTQLLGTLSNGQVTTVDDMRTLFNVQNAEATTVQDTKATILSNIEYSSAVSDLDWIFEPKGLQDSTEEIREDTNASLSTYISDNKGTILQNNDQAESDKGRTSSINVSDATSYMFTGTSLNAQSIEDNMTEAIRAKISPFDVTNIASFIPEDYNNELFLRNEAVVATNQNQVQLTQEEPTPENEDKDVSSSTNNVETASFSSVDYNSTLSQAEEAFVRTPQRLFRLDNAGNVQIQSNALEQIPELSDLEMDLPRLALAQSDALALGQSLISGGAPLAATLPRNEHNQTTCWKGSNISLEALPGILMWLDILSSTTRLDLNTIEPNARLLIMEAALNPNRLVQCIWKIDSDYSKSLLENSIFLRESEQNRNFSEFLFRNFRDSDLEIIGINLMSDRYVQLSDSRKLREGSAPDVEKRIEVIGDLGVVVRVAGGYLPKLYDENIHWIVRMDNDIPILEN